MHYCSLYDLFLLLILLPTHLGMIQGLTYYPSEMQFRICFIVVHECLVLRTSDIRKLVLLSTLTPNTVS